MNLTLPHHLHKLPTGIEGFDLILEGGLPRGRSTLVSGTAGTAKTVLACQFLAEGIRQFDEGGVFVTFEESPHDIRDNMRSLGWEIEGWESASKWAFVDGSPRIDEEVSESGTFDLGGLLARVELAIRKVNAKRVSIDSTAGLLVQFADPNFVRRELHRAFESFKNLGVTTIITAEREDDTGPFSRTGIEEFVADNVILLRNQQEKEKRRRTVEVLKLRGTGHQKGQFPFTVAPNRGVVVLPLSAVELTQRSSNTRISSGVKELDEMCGGGYYRDAIILASGPTGTGKTLLSTHFIAGGATANERCLLFAFEESRDQLFRNATGWGVDFEKMEADGLLRVVAIYPEAKTLEDHLITIKSEVESFRPTRVAVDSLTALERVSSEEMFREFVVGVTAFIKQQEIAGLFTATASSLLGGTSVTEAHISTITDLILLLRYVEAFGEMRRGLTVLKMRGSMHDKRIREVSIDGSGLNVGKAFRNISGIMSGNFSHVPPFSEVDRLSCLFKEDAAGDRNNASQ